jgi:hypothetical protein
LCLSFSETLTFPQRRVEIYEEALDALLKKWDSSRRIKRDEVYRKLSLGRKENMLACIAAETFQKNQYFILQPELEHYITDYIKNVPPHDINETADGEAILKALEAQHGIFVERARGIYSFSHLTFQEYFTAKYIVANATERILKNLIKYHSADERWREVFLLTTSLLQDASSFMRYFRRGIDELLRGDEKLKMLLAWAKKKSDSIPFDPSLVRSGYLFIELFHESETTGLRKAIGRASAFDLNLAPSFELDYELRLALTTEYGDAYKSVNINRLTRISHIARSLGINEFTEELSALSPPTREATDEEWQKFTSQIRMLATKHRDIRHEWKLTKTQEEQLTDYLNANLLFRECLALAFMPPDERRTMLESLYLPPDEGNYE